MPRHTRFVLDAGPTAPEVAHDVAGAVLHQMFPDGSAAECTAHTARQAITAMVSLASARHPGGHLTCELKRDAEHLFVAVEVAAAGQPLRDVPLSPEESEHVALLRSLAETVGTHETGKGEHVVWAALPLPADRPG